MAVAMSCLLIPGSAAGFNGIILRGFGTATIDGVAAPGEWNPAGNVTFSANRAAAQGGGTVPATIYAMNDAMNLYIAIKVDNATVGASTADVSFDGDHDNSATEDGEDNIMVDSLGFFDDRFKRQGANVYDLADGGTRDGDERDADGPGYSFYEFSHPLDSTDNAHDFSLRPPMRIGFRLSFRHCSAVSSCASTSSYPSGIQLAEIVIVSGNRVAPDTQITDGPADRSMIADSQPTFEFTGSDDILQPSQLTFECKLDEDPWHECTSPKILGVEDGRHTFTVRAADDMLNVDPSPPQRSWTSDTTGPSKPRIRGRRSVRQGKKLLLRFSARDELAGGVRFRCSLNRKPYRRCPARYRVKGRLGRNVVLVRADDRLGNDSELAAFLFKVKRAR